MRAISNVVDASNLVMLELGQPTHPYDAAHVGEADDCGPVARAPARRSRRSTASCATSARPVGDSATPVRTASSSTATTRSRPRGHHGRCRQ